MLFKNQEISTDPNERMTSRLILRVKLLGREEICIPKGDISKCIGKALKKTAEMAEDLNSDTLTITVQMGVKKADTLG